MTTINTGFPQPEINFDELMKTAENAKLSGQQARETNAWIGGYMTLARQIADGTHTVEARYEEDGERRIEVNPVDRAVPDHGLRMAEMPEVPSGITEMLDGIVERTHRAEQERLLGEMQVLVDQGVKLSEIRVVQMGWDGQSHAMTAAAMDAMTQDPHPGPLPGGEGGR